MVRDSEGGPANALVSNRAESSSSSSLTAESFEAESLKSLPFSFTSSDDKFKKCVQMFDFGTNMTTAAVAVIAADFDNPVFDKNGCLTAAEITAYKKNIKQQTQLQKIEDILYEMEETKGNRILKSLRISEFGDKLFRRNVHNPEKRRSHFFVHNISDAMAQDCIDHDVHMQPYASRIRENLKAGTLALPTEEHPTCGVEDMKKIICEVGYHHRHYAMDRASDLLDKVILRKVSFSANAACFPLSPCFDNKKTNY